MFLLAVLAVSVCQAKKKTSDKVYDVGMDNVRTLEAVKDLLEVSKLDEMTVRLRGVKILSVEEPVSKAKSKISKAASTVTFGLINSKDAEEYQQLTAKDITESSESGKDAGIRL